MKFSKDSVKNAADILHSWRSPNTTHDHQKTNAKLTSPQPKRGKKQNAEIADEEIILTEHFENKEAEDFYRSINCLYQEKRSQNTSDLPFPDYFVG